MSYCFIFFKFEQRRMHVRMNNQTETELSDCLTFSIIKNRHEFVKLYPLLQLSVRKKARKSFTVLFQLVFIRKWKSREILARAQIASIHHAGLGNLNEKLKPIQPERNIKTRAHRVFFPKGLNAITLVEPIFRIEKNCWSPKCYTCRWSALPLAYSAEFFRVFSLASHSVVWDFHSYTEAYKFVSLSSRLSSRNESLLSPGTLLCRSASHTKAAAGELLRISLFFIF